MSVQLQVTSMGSKKAPKPKKAFPMHLIMRVALYGDWLHSEKVYRLLSSLLAIPDSVLPKMGFHRSHRCLNKFPMILVGDIPVF